MGARKHRHAANSVAFGCVVSTGCSVMTNSGCRHNAPLDVQEQISFMDAVISHVDIFEQFALWNVNGAGIPVRKDSVREIRKEGSH